MADTQSHAGMLSGCRVLDFTQYLAGPTVTRLMAEMGADIIKVEIAPMGDPARLLPTIKAGRVPTWGFCPINDQAVFDYEIEHIPFLKVLSQRDSSTSANRDERVLPPS
jgi:hypothetical protein